MLRLLLPLILFFSFNIYAKDKQQMPAMHHLIKIKPSVNISIPESFPLNKKQQIDCQTCHGIKDMEENNFKKIDKQAKDFFRQGPYKRLSDFCYRCHDTKPYQRDNIHKMLDDNGKIIKNTCLYCHQKALDPEKDIRPDELKLRLPAQNICYGCHLYTPHFNALNHQKKPDKEMQKRIKESAQKHKIILPLSDDGKIMCVTCHNPHQIDVINQRKPAGKQIINYAIDKGIVYLEHPWNKVFIADKKNRLDKLQQKINKKLTLEYMRIEKEILLRLPAKDGQLCMACHQFES
jgi:hypothetical protein